MAAACYGSALLSLPRPPSSSTTRCVASLRMERRVPAAAASPAALWLGSPLLYYATLAPGFSHAPCALRGGAPLLADLGEWAEPARKVLAPSRPDRPRGAAGGLCALVREQDGLFLVMPGPATSPSRTGAPTAAWPATGSGAALAMGAPRYRGLRAPAPAPTRPSTGLCSRADRRREDALLEPALPRRPVRPGPQPLLLEPRPLRGRLRPRPRRSRGGRYAPRPPGLRLLLQVWICGSIQVAPERRLRHAAIRLRHPLLRPRHRPPLAAALVPAAAALRCCAMALFAWWNVSLMVQFGLRLMDRQRLEWPGWR